EKKDRQIIKEEKNNSRKRSKNIRFESSPQSNKKFKYSNNYMNINNVVEKNDDQDTQYEEEKRQNLLKNTRAKSYSSIIKKNCKLMSYGQNKDYDSMPKTSIKKKVRFQKEVTIIPNLPLKKNNIDFPNLINENNNMLISYEQNRNINNVIERQGNQNVSIKKEIKINPSKLDNVNNNIMNLNIVTKNNAKNKYMNSVNDTCQNREICTPIHMTHKNNNEIFKSRETESLSKSLQKRDMYIKQGLYKDIGMDLINVVHKLREEKAISEQHEEKKIEPTNELSKNTGIDSNDEASITTEFKTVDEILAENERRILNYYAMLDKAEAIKKEQEIKNNTNENLIKKEKEIKNSADKILIKKEQEIKNSADKILIKKEQEIKNSADKILIKKEKEINNSTNEILIKKEKEIKNSIDKNLIKKEKEEPIVVNNNNLSPLNSRKRALSEKPTPPKKYTKKILKRNVNKSASCSPSQSRHSLSDNKNIYAKNDMKDIKTLEKSNNVNDHNENSHYSEGGATDSSAAAQSSVDKMYERYLKYAGTKRDWENRFVEGKSNPFSNGQPYHNDILEKHTSCLISERTQRHLEKRSYEFQKQKERERMNRNSTRPVVEAPKVKEYNCKVLTEYWDWDNEQTKEFWSWDKKDNLNFWNMDYDNAKKFWMWEKEKQETCKNISNNTMNLENEDILNIIKEIIESRNINIPTTNTQNLEKNIDISTSTPILEKNYMPQKNIPKTPKNTPTPPKNIQTTPKNTPTSKKNTPTPTKNTSTPTKKYSNNIRK
ncbi:hypothetical protein, partial [Plasmodium yoelii yoelii]